MELKKKVKEIESIKGYKGSAILNKTGEIIHIDERETIDLAFSSSLFNDTFRVLNEASLDIGLTNLVRLEAQTDEGMIFLIYSNHQYTVFTIFDSKGNISLAKMVLAQLLKKA